MSSSSSPPSSVSASPPHRSKTAPPPGLAADLDVSLDDDLSTDESPYPSVPPPRSTSPSAVNTSLPPTSSGPSTPLMMPSALRRSNSSTSSGSAAEPPSSKEKKRLRFTAIHDQQSALGLDTGDREEFYYPGAPSLMEEGRIRKAVPKDQADYLKSDPGTPNIQET